MCTRSLPAAQAQGPRRGGLLWGPWLARWSAVSWHGQGQEWGCRSAAGAGRGCPGASMGDSLGPWTPVRAVLGWSWGRRLPSRSPHAQHPSALLSVCSPCPACKLSGRHNGHPRLPTAAGGTQQPPPRSPEPPSSSAVLAHSSSGVSSALVAQHQAPGVWVLPRWGRQSPSAPKAAASWGSVPAVPISPVPPAPMAPLEPQEPESAPGKAQVRLQITTLTDTPMAEAVDPLATSRAPWCICARHRALSLSRLCHITAPQGKVSQDTLVPAGPWCPSRPPVWGCCGELGCGAWVASKQKVPEKPLGAPG